MIRIAVSVTPRHFSRLACWGCCCALPGNGSRGYGSSSCDTFATSSLSQKN